MSHSATTLLFAILVGSPLLAQTSSGQAAVLLDWRRVGTTVVDLSLASLAGGPIDRVWYDSDGSRLYARTQKGRVWQTSDFEKWQSVTGPIEPPARPAGTPSAPQGKVSVVHPAQASRVYAAGKFAYRSDDGGLNWTNLSAVGNESILGGVLTDVTVSPRNSDEVVVAGASGVWRSMDGGDSWTGLNEGLPALPIDRILPPSTAPFDIVRIVSNGMEMQWAAGERVAWRIADKSELERELALRSSASTTIGKEITAAASAGTLRYAGSSDGALFFSRDNGVNWGASGLTPGAGRVGRIVVDPIDPNVALAVTDSRARGRVLRTFTAGVFWEDLTGNLSAQIAVRGVAADRASGTVYIATDRGVYSASATNSGSPSWTLLREGSTTDVALDATGNQLFVAFEDDGLFASLAPHRLQDPRVVSSADRMARAAAPGSLLSVIGARLQSARIGDRNAPVLAESDAETQLQVPFEVSGRTMQLSATTAAGSRQIPLALLPTSPSIFLDRDGAPLVMNADTGLMLEPGAPARSGARLHILVTGLGRVRPDWPTGLAAPLENPPAVITPVRAYLDREPVEVTRATLAPGYVGMYLVEVQLPSLVNRGTAEFYLETQDQQSNRVRIFLEP